MLAHAKQRTNRRFRNKRVRNGATSLAMHRVYDSFGNLVSQTNPSASLGVAAVDCLFGYTGKAFDRATGSQNNLNRWFDPSVGTWLSEDPAAADENLYRYAGNGPTDGTDPSGRAEVRVKPGYDASWYPSQSGGGPRTPKYPEDYEVHLSDGSWVPLVSNNASGLAAPAAQPPQPATAENILARPSTRRVG